MSSTRRPGAITRDTESKSSSRINDLIDRLTSLNARDRKLLRLLQDLAEQASDEASADRPDPATVGVDRRLDSFVQRSNPGQAGRHTALE